MLAGFASGVHAKNRTHEPIEEYINVRTREGAITGNTAELVFFSTCKMGKRGRIEKRLAAVGDDVREIAIAEEREERVAVATDSELFVMDAGK